MKCAVHKACNHIRTRETWYWGGLHGNRAGDRESNVWEDLEADSSGLRGDDNVERKGCRSSFICTVKIPLEIKIEFLLWSFGFSTRVGGIILNTKCVFYIHRQEQFILRICPPRSVVHYTAESKRQSGGLFFFFADCLYFLLLFALDWTCWHCLGSVRYPLLVHCTEEMNVCLDVLYGVEGLRTLWHEQL